MAARIDEVSPAFVGEERIRITLDPVNPKPKVDLAVTVLFDYADAEPEGIALPLVLELQPAFGTGEGYRRREYRELRPSSFTFRTPLAGDYLLLLRESAHNRWRGTLKITVMGDEFVPSERT